MKDMVQASDKIAQGNTAEIFRLENGRILKLFRNGIARDAVEREYDNTRVASALLPQVPKAYDLIEQDGRIGIVFQEVSGTEMLRMMTIHPLRIRSSMHDFAQYHARIAKPVSANMRSVRDKLRDEIGWQTALTEQEKERTLGMLFRLPDGDRLCHFDFHPGNVMVNGENVFFLDWMTACKGDPRADAARTWLLLKYGEPLHASKKQRLLICSVMRFAGGIYLRQYRRLTGIGRKEIREWLVPVAAARLSEWLTDHEKGRLISLIQSELQKRRHG